MVNPNGSVRTSSPEFPNEEQLKHNAVSALQYARQLFGRLTVEVEQAIERHNAPRLQRLAPHQSHSVSAGPWHIEQRYDQLGANTNLALMLSLQDGYWPNSFPPEWHPRSWLSAVVKVPIASKLTQHNETLPEWNLTQYQKAEGVFPFLEIKGYDTEMYLFHFGATTLAISRSCDATTKDLCYRIRIKREEDVRNAGGLIIRSQQVDTIEGDPTIFALACLHLAPLKEITLPQ